jgi:hypothetical protein
VPGIHSGKELRRLHYPLIFESVFRMRQALFVKGGFVHTEFDFLDAFSKEYLIVCGRTCVDFKLVNDILGIVEWTGTHDASHIAQLARSTIDRVCPDSVILASNTVDGALQAASESMLGEGREHESNWCFCHQLALPIKKSLDCTKRPGAVAEDFAFMHFFGVFIRSHSNAQETLDRLRGNRISLQGEKETMQMVMLNDSLARWTSERRKLKRFLQLRVDLIAFSKVASMMELLNEWKHENKAPRDAFKPPFWARLDAMSVVIEKLHKIVKASQSSQTVVISSIPWWLMEIEKAVILEEDDPSEVRDWKTTFLGLFLKQFADMKRNVNFVWLACALDP